MGYSSTILGTTGGPMPVSGASKDQATLLPPNRLSPVWTSHWPKENAILRPSLSRIIFPKKSTPSGSAERKNSYERGRSQLTQSAALAQTSAHETLYCCPGPNQPLPPDYIAPPYSNTCHLKRALAPAERRRGLGLPSQRGIQKKTG
uniref:Uncharacterized protein n=1 Tax=Kwoniella bestiolae CBS 10118 TaxID=1296100 RepID=A0A1B9GD32_9TREE|nr:hypothetical protein I302_00418 [Kwoniella bestiolae CBS 10118]OCF28928.1 hypothetical protein I302_00418 [Kwoniella bestiolae CBS 10118]